MNKTVHHWYMVDDRRFILFRFVKLVLCPHFAQSTTISRASSSMLELKLLKYRVKYTSAMALHVQVKTTICCCLLTVKNWIIHLMVGALAYRVLPQHKRFLSIVSRQKIAWHTTSSIAWVHVAKGQFPCQNEVNLN